VGGNGFGTRSFWIAAIPDSDVQVHFGAGTAEMSVSNLPALDYVNLQTSVGPNWQTAFVGATVSFDVVWSGPITRAVTVTDGSNGDQFAGDFVENQATVTWSATNANGFSFTGNPGQFSTSIAPFAELGQEQNGSFFGADSPTQQDGLAGALIAAQAATVPLSGAARAARPWAPAPLAAPSLTGNLPPAGSATTSQPGLTLAAASDSPPGNSPAWASLDGTMPLWDATT
jgi:hypothetical protein